MCKRYDIAYNTIKEFVNNKKPFRYSELKREILKRGGLLRLAPNYTVLEFLQTLVYNDTIKRVGDYYIPTKVLQ